MGNTDSSQEPVKGVDPAVRAAIAQRLQSRGIDASALLRSVSSNSSAAANDYDMEEVWRLVSKMQDSIDRLAFRCDALEAETILVTVQQLDLLARGTAWALSLSSLYLYWRLMVVNVVHHVRPILVASVVPSLFPTLSATTSSWIISVPLHLALFSIPLVHHSYTHGLTHRRFEVFAIAAIIIGRIRFCRWRERLFASSPPTFASSKVQEHQSSAASSSETRNSNAPLTAEEIRAQDHELNENWVDVVDPTANSGNVTTVVSRFGEHTTEEAIWESNYEINARFLYVSIRRLRGLWTKTAQYMSSRADFMPTAYVRELKKLQDEAPATPWAELEPQLPRSVKQQLKDIDPNPIASASIGQVHIAKLRSTGQKVVLKVQHPFARTLLTDDFWSLHVIARIVAWMEPEYVFLRILIEEWAVEARKELDFRLEAQNLQDAQHSISLLFPNNDTVLYAPSSDGKGRIPFQVEIPKPIHQMTTAKYLVMSFCEGTRIDNFQQIDRWGLDKKAVMNGVSQTFAHMMYCCGPFNGDPHPGNLFVRRGTLASPKDDGFTLVLLDWGLAKRLSESEQLGFCQMVYAAETLDYGLLLDSYKTIGLKMKKENSASSMMDVRFVLRDMVPTSVAKKRLKNKLRHDSKRLEESKEKVPMDSKAYPGVFFFFIRVNELLHGLGSKMGVTMPFLEVISPYAERGLRQSKLYNRVTTTTTAPTLTHQLESIDQELERKLLQVFDELEEEGKLAGAQMRVLDSNAQTIVDVVAGHLGGLKSHIAMKRNNLVLGFSCTKAVTATIAHLMVKEGYMTYDEPLCERVWKRFCPTKVLPEEMKDPNQSETAVKELEQQWRWKREITLRHVLTHSAGMHDALPSVMTIQSMCSCEACVKAFEYDPDAPTLTLLPSRKPGEASEYHFMSFGWLVAGAVCGAYAAKHGRTEPVTYREVYEKILLPKLSAQTLAYGFKPLGGSGEFELALTAISNVSATARMLQLQREANAMGEKTPQGSNGDQPMPSSEILNRFRGKEFLLDPRVWNSVDGIDANVPAAGGRFSAAALAHFYLDLKQILGPELFEEVSKSHATTTAGGMQGATSLSSSTSGGPEDTNDLRSRSSLGFGYQLLRIDSNDPIEHPSCMGHAGVGGSIGFCHRPSGMCVALMLNKADEGEATTVRILKVWAEHFGLMQK